MAKLAGGKNRKYGRNAKWCAAYALSNRREQNKAVRLARHLKRHPGDVSALAAIDRLKSIIPNIVRAALS